MSSLCTPPSIPRGRRSGASYLVSSFTAKELVGTVEPQADVVVELHDFAYVMPDEIKAGEQLWEVKNEGDQFHMMALLKPNPGVTLDDLKAAFAAMERGELTGPPPFEFVSTGGHMDIFAVSEDGVLYHNRWDGDWRGWWWQTDQEFPPGSPLAAQSRHPLHMEVFAIGVDNRVHHAWWDGGWHAWFPVLGNPPMDMDFYPPVTAVTRNDSQLDIFAISRQQEEEFVWSNWWHASWKRWFILP